MLTCRQYNCNRGLLYNTISFYLLKSNGLLVSRTWSDDPYRLGRPGAKTIKKNTNSTTNKSQTQCARAYEVTSFLSTDCELSTDTCSKKVHSLGPRVEWATEHGWKTGSSQSDPRTQIIINIIIITIAIIIIDIIAVIIIIIIIIKYTSGFISSFCFGHFLQLV